MSRTREFAAGGRAVEVEPERLAGFLDRFAAGHTGAVVTTVTPQRVDATAVDSWTASIPVPLGSLAAQSGQRDGIAMDDLLEHLLAPRTVELLLVRLGGYSVGVARAEVVLTSSTGSRLVSHALSIMLDLHRNASPQSPGSNRSLSASPSRTTPTRPGRRSSSCSGTVVTACITPQRFGAANPLAATSHDWKALVGAGLLVVDTSGPENTVRRCGDDRRRGSSGSADHRLAPDAVMASTASPRPSRQAPQRVLAQRGSDFYLNVSSGRNPPWRQLADHHWG